MTETTAWRDMATAPKDGTEIRVLVRHMLADYSADPVGDGYEAEATAHWIDHNGGGWTWHGLCGRFVGWQPLEPRT